MILTLHKAAELSTEVVGGKAKNLAQLHRFGFQVPVSWVLPARLYECFVMDSPLKGLLGGSTPLSEGQTEELLAHLQSRQMPMELAEQFEKLEAPMAVRSSATCEDGEQASFAGVHSSFLNIRGQEALWQAVKDCYCSLWTPRAQAYRQKMGFPHHQVNCAVLLCTMVEAQFAGVSFTCEPLTGQRDCLVVNAGVGLGDSVVSGATDPQRALISFQRGLLEVVERGSRACLDDQGLLSLARLCIRIHWALGRGEQSQDIEWCFDGERYVILQSRPVTKVGRATYEGLRDHPIIWSNANLKDILPGVQSTLSWNLTQGSIRNIGFATIDAVGGYVPKGMEFCKRICGRAYLDMTALQWALHDTFGLPPERTIRDMGAVAPVLRLPHGALSKKAPQRAYRGVKLLLRVMALSWKLPAAIRKLESTSRKAMDWNLEELAPRELLKRLYFIRDALFEFSKLYQFVNVRASISVRALQFICRLLAPRTHKQLLTQALRGNSQMVSARQGQELYRLVGLAQVEDAARLYLADVERNPQGWKELPEDSLFKNAFQSYLQEFGHRAVYELKLENPRWAEDPSYILEQISMMMDQPGPGESEEVANSPLLSLLSPLSHLAGDSLVSRERAKSALVWALFPTRRVLLEIGRRLSEDSVVEEPGDIFHWCWSDLECYLLGEWSGSGSRQLVESRKEEAEGWRATAEPATYLVLDKWGGAVDWGGQRSLISEPLQTSGAELQGTGASAGVARGVARILTDPGQGTRFQSGEILVAPSTDPGWTPLFARASAVVMEVGGELSHGAIVAREFGLPAVVGIPGLLERVEDGSEIVVDGGRGTVRILDLDS